MKVIDASYEMTGGGCHTYWGKFDDGNYFVFGLNVFQKLDADYGVTFTEESFKETGGDTYDWERKHKIGRMAEYPHVSKEIDEYISQTFDVLIKNASNSDSKRTLESLMQSELNLNY